MKVLKICFVLLLVSSPLAITTATEDVRFYLYTLSNPENPLELFTNDINSIRTSSFDWRNPTKIIVYGYLINLDFIDVMKEAYLSVGPHNVIVVNWLSSSLKFLPSAIADMPKTGQQIAKFIDFMAHSGYLRPENLTLAGHSLGAHVIGHAGRSIRSGKLQTIIGLDPSSTLIPFTATDIRLCASDAFYVESIQTNADLMGYAQPVGRATFYPNGGKSQQGCDLDLGGSCSHFKAYKFYAEAIKSNGFPSIQCHDYTHALAKSCGGKYSDSVHMGSPSNAYLANGVYYVPVQPNPPYRLRNKPKYQPVTKLGRRIQTRLHEIIANTKNWLEN